MDYSLTRQEKRLIVLLRWWIVLFAAAGAGFALLPDHILNFLNTAGHVIFKWSGPTLEPSSEHFWLVMTISMMVILVFSAIKAQMDIVKNIFYVRIIIVSKLVSTLGFIVVFVLTARAFAYLTGAVVDGVIFLLTLLAYRRAIWSRCVT